MVLYEDLRVYTFWRTEAAHYRSQQIPYRKTGTEWELLGDLALRLWHEVMLITVPTFFYSSLDGLL